MPQTGSAEQLFEEGRLDDAIEALNEALRSDPTDVQSRTFLFELLCFSGAHARARAQLDAISTADPDALLSASWYKEALLAQEQRDEMFREGKLPDTDADARPVSGTLNGQPFDDLRDADPRIGPRMELLVGGRYSWIPFEHLARVQIEPPRRLRDLYWIPAQIEGTDAVGSLTNEVLLPVMTPGAARHDDDLVRLGRVTEWEEIEGGGEAPVGQKLLLVDGEDVSLLEVRELTFDSPGE
ncbi:MAG: type VI secretion system accessory protein TagJ [Gemmatimonadota bacterium]|nr:type VI secretion system accessory protein TagJ [Gemmatimonadota bacterium]